MNPLEGEKPSDNDHWLDTRELSFEAHRLLALARGHETYRADVQDWIHSDNPFKAAEGNFVAGLLSQFEDPQQAREYFEEARRLFIDRNYYQRAAEAAKMLSLVFEHQLNNSEAAASHAELAEEYRAEAGQHRPLR